MNFLENISSKLEHLRPKEKSIANVILKYSHKVISLSIAEVAELANVSEPTVHRFCQKFNAKGFPDFKLKIAQSLTPTECAPVEENDNTSAIMQKIFTGTISALNQAKKQIDIKTLDSVVDRLQSARRIYFCGLGASATVAHALMNTFLRLGIPCNYYEDTVMMRTAAAISDINDVFVLISNSGQTRALVDVAQAARSQKATVISITKANSYLANVSSKGMVLSIKMPQNTDMYIPMISTLVQMAIVDVIATAFIMRMGSDFRVSLKRVKNIINGSRLRTTEELNQEHEEMVQEELLRREKEEQRINEQKEQIKIQQDELLRIQQQEDLIREKEKQDNKKQ